MTSRFAFLPNARSVMTRATLPPASGGARLRLAYQLEIQANGAPAPSVPRLPVESELKGPGDVAGFNRQIISRVEPAAGLRGFEPNYLPFVEFVDADLPWRYTLTPGTAARLQPWIVLLALKPDEFEFVNQGRAPLPRIRVFNQAASLPNLTWSWAHAHVQVAPDAGQPAGVAAAVTTNPSAHFSRLLCARRVAERSTYHLFLVPSYEAGRLTGLGESGEAQPFDAPAWDIQATDPVELPVYFQSRFTTNALEDVETLLRRLRPVSAAEAASVGAATRASAARPGYYPDYQKPGTTFQVQGALRRADAAVEPYQTEAPLAKRLVTTLQEVIAGERVALAADGPDKDDPLVAMPAYGWRFRSSTTLSATSAKQNRWFDRTNLDLKFRQVAGLGAETVRRNQELFAQKCWEQYEAIMEANHRLQRLRVADLMVQRTAMRRFDRLPSDVAVALAEPLHAYVPAAAGGKTVLDLLRSGGTPTTFASRGLRRIAAKRPIHVPTSTSGAAVAGIVTPMPAVPGDRTPGADRFGKRATAAAPASPGASVAFQPGVETALNQLFGTGAFAGTPRPGSVGVPVAEFDSLSLHGAVARTLTSLPKAKANFVVSGRVGAEKDALEPLYRSPVVPLPLAKWLEPFAAERILTNTGNLPDNSVSAFEENRLFVEAFLVGANHAMNNELRWREFPTDMRGTIFRRFWDRGQPPDDAAGDDIAQIHTWAAGLGQHASPAADNSEADLVIVIRGDIIRKLGQLVVVLNEADGTQWVSGQGTNHSPVFFGRIGPDVAYYGFDVSRAHILASGVKERTFLVLYEPVGRLRFGLDVATASVRQQRRQYEALSLPFPVGSLARSYDQLPARLPGVAAPAPARPATWDDLSWSHLHLEPSGYLDFTQTLRIQGQPDYWGAAKTSATIARSLWQKPLAGVLPLGRVL